MVNNQLDELSVDETGLAATTENDTTCGIAKKCHSKQISRCSLRSSTQFFDNGRLMTTPGGVGLLIVIQHLCMITKTHGNNNHHELVITTAAICHHKT